jgi:Phycobilisome protein/Protein of unknown function (DUF2384)
MHETITNFLSPIKNQAEFQEVIQRLLVQERLRPDVAKVIADHAELIVAQATQGMIQVTPDFTEMIHNILSCVTYALLSECASVLDPYLLALNKICVALGLSIQSVTQTIPLLKHAAITSVQKHYPDNCANLLAELSAYFDYVICALDVPANDISELMTELDLTASSTGRLQNLLERLSDLLDHSKQYMRLWLTSPHPDFGGKPPIFYLQRDKIEVVENLIEAIEAGQIG